MTTNTYRKIMTVSYEDSGYLYFKNISNTTGKFTPVVQRGLVTPNLEYSLDGVNWTTYDIQFMSQNPTGPHIYYGTENYTRWDLQGILVGPGRHIYLRGVNATWNTQWNGIGFTMDVPHAVGGNIVSLVDYNNMGTITSLPNYFFGNFGLFSMDTQLVDASQLNFGNISTLGTHSLSNLFYKCTSLLTGPNLSGISTVGESALRSIFENCTSLNYNIDLSSVTTVGTSGLYRAFRGCSAMTTMPSLGAITSIPNSAFRETFYNCQNLNGNVDLSSVTSVDGNGLRETFYNCQNLNGNVDLSSVTTLADYGMYQTFYNCYNLDGVINMSQLSQISGQSLNGTFRNCRTLTHAPSLANLTTFNGGNCMTNTYRDCYLLQEVTAPNMNPWDTSQSMSWMENAGRDVPAGTQKTAYVPSGVTIDSSVDGIPGDWTQVPY